MSGAEAQTGEAPDITEVSKTVTVVGYLKDESVDLRYWADAYFDNRDFFEMKESESISRKLVFPDGTEERLTTTKYKKYEGYNLGDLDLVKESNITKDYKYSLGNAGTFFRREITSDWPEEGPLGVWSNKWGDLKSDDNEYLVKTYSFLERKALLVHQSEMTPDNMYVDPNVQYPCFRFKFKLKNVNKDELGYLEDELVKPFIEDLADHKEIGRVRIAECESTEKGACFNI